MGLSNYRVRRCLPDRVSARTADGQGRVASAVLLLLLCVPHALTAQVDPAADYQTLRTAHFRVTYQRELEAQARHAAARAEAVHAVLSATFARAPEGTINIVLADDVDLTNGAASPFPSNRIWVYAKPPVDLPALAYNDDWIDLVITHELAHVFHLDAHGKLGDAFRTVFGRLPFTWPIFPALGTPLWSIEGLAVQVESALTGYGRIHGSWHETVVRTAVLADEPDPIDRITGSTPIWPGNERVYIYGSLFLDWVAQTYGDSVPALIVREVARSWLPPGLFFNRIPRDVSGHSFTELYTEWLAVLRDRYDVLADSLRVRGLTVPTHLTQAGYRAAHPRFSPDAATLAYAAADGRSVARTRVIDARSGAARRDTRRNTLAALAWTPTGTIVTSQLEWHGRNRFHSDLYRIDAAGKERRLTVGARLQDPDVARDGRRIVAIGNRAGTTTVELLGFDGERIVSRRTVAGGSANVQWALPRFSPDGTRIAVSRSEAGLYQLVLLDTAGTLVREVTRDAALDMGAAFSPDGRWLVFSSDRTGIANLYAADLHDPTAPLRQVTNVLGGAYEPDIAADGSAIVFSAYAADGFHVARLPFEPSSWRAAPATSALASNDRRGTRAWATRADTTIYAGISIPADTSVRRTGDYRPWSTLRPYFWLPLAWTIEDVGTFLGASSFGRDVVGRHTWSAWLAVAPDNGRTMGEAAWSYAGWRNPVPTIAVERDWDRIGFVPLPQNSTQIRPVNEREDALTARLGFVRPHVRTSLSASVGGELVRRRRIIEDGGGARLADAADDLLGLVAGVSLTTARAQPFSISAEDGVTLSLTGRQRWDRNAGDFDGGYRELTSHNTAYRSIDLPGFARHVLGLRLSGLYRSGDGATPSSIGGASGVHITAPVELGLGAGQLLLPLRGYPRGVRAGTRAWTASAEYRFPITAVGRGIRVLPLFLDRLSGALFADAGDAWCPGELADRFLRCTSADPQRALLSAGAELNLDLGLFGYTSVRTRLGAAVPLRGPERGVALYLRLGQAF